MSNENSGLLNSRRFLPIFVTLFLGAFNDNLFKIAMLTLITYDLSKVMELNAAILNPLAAGLFILPFALFSSLAGQLADKYEKSKQIRIIKIAEVGIMIIGAISLYYSIVWLMFVTLFLLGLQSTFFGPIKYSILPEHLRSNELVRGNALVETATFIAILLGNIVGGLLVRSDGGLFWTSGLTLVAALTGVYSAFNVPKTTCADPGLTVHANPLTSTSDMIRKLLKDKKVTPIVMLISWFWMFGSLFLAQFPSFTEAVVRGDESVLTLFIGCFSIGIGIGSMLCAKLLKGEVSLKYVPMAALMMSAFTIDLYFASSAAQTQPDAALIGATAFLSAPHNWRIFADLIGIAIASGVYIVPVYTSLQTRSSDHERSRMIAANNIINSIFMVGSAILAMVTLKAGYGIIDIFLVGAALNLLVVIYLLKQRIQDDALRKILLKFSTSKSS